LPANRKLFQYYQQHSEELKKIRETLQEYIVDFHRGVRKNFENLRLGFVKGNFESLIARSAIFLYLPFEAFMGELFGEDVSAYWSHMIFMNAYNDLKNLQEEGVDDLLPELEITEEEAQEALDKVKIILKIAPDPTEEEHEIQKELIRKVIKQTTRHSYQYFFYGRPQYFSEGGEVSNYGSAWSRWLYEKDENFKQMFGVALAENTEVAMMVIIDDIETGKYSDWIDIDMGDAYRAGEIYGYLKFQMRECDLHRIGNGSSSIFNLPEYGI